MLKSFFLALVSSYAVAIMVHAQDQTGFISLDCGLPEDSSYTEPTTGIYYISDAAYIETGITKSVLPEFQTGQQQQTWRVRSFPEGERNCYNLNLRQGDRYLIRATFMHGNYDGMSRYPKFDLHLGPNLWSTITVQNASAPIFREIIHVIQSSHLFVCLVNTGTGIPFISALELRLLKNTTYKTQTGSLELFARYDVGSLTEAVIRFKEDVYDRLWWPYNGNGWTQVSTPSTNIGSLGNDYQPPSLAMRSAGTSANASQSLDFFIDSRSVPNAAFYVYMHFAEVQVLQANESRKFNVSYNGKYWYGPIRPPYLSSFTLYTVSAMTGGDYRFSLYRTADSTLPPILNALEVYTVKQFLQSETIQIEVDAISNIKSMYGLKRNWQGDPCGPQEHLWTGLNCSYDGYNPPTIISLNLSSSGLTGEILPYIANLTRLKYLDLSNNNLTGPLPEFLSQLQSLTVINLEENMLNGTVPAALIERSSKNGLVLRVEGNPNLCPSLSCTITKTKHINVPILAASIASVSVLIIIAVSILWMLNWRKPPLAADMDDESNTLFPSLKSRKRRFKFSEVQTMTNNFESPLGAGGFGKVYHGHIEGTQVAVKMLSKKSIQGYKEFEAEVKSLFRAHHKNLTTLIGYCKEGANLGIIYEYMAQGNLAQHLSGSISILDWEQRIQVALGAGKGLEYLHKSCKPPIIHRDVKPTNILLDENFQAKLADFGLSKSIPIGGGSHVLASKIAGTTGYLDPEYQASQILTEKSDVYSFGVVLLEIITGRRVIEQTNNVSTHIIQWVRPKLSRRDIKNIVDPRLQGDFDVNSAWKAVELAMKCVSQTSTRRPTMNQVVAGLSQCLPATGTRPKRRT